MSFGFPELIFSVENHIICPTNLWHKWALISLIFYKNSLYCCSIDFYKGWVNQTLSQLVTIKGTSQIDDAHGLLAVQNREGEGNDGSAEGIPQGLQGAEEVGVPSALQAVN